MASILRRVVAGPRAPHPEANLDLCYVTDFIIATSGPSSTYPSRAYRNPLDALVRFLDSKHGANWAIWEFRAEGTGYPDEEVYGRIWHFPWPDHHPPPFKLVPGIMASMRDWLNGDGGAVRKKSAAPFVDGGAPAKYDTSDDESVNEPPKGADRPKPSGRVVVVHCKAGKGRSGSMAVSYLMSEEGWTREAALQRFTERRMRPGFGQGVSIPSQLRWLSYVERWKDNGKIYVEQAIEVLEVHVVGMRDGVKIAVEGYVDGGRTIKTYHVFKREERDDYEEGVTSAADDTPGITAALGEVVRRASTIRRTGSKSKSRNTSRDVSPNKLKPPEPATSQAGATSPGGYLTPRTPTSDAATPSELPSETDNPSLKNVIFRPRRRLVLKTNDINLVSERRTGARSYGWSMVTSIAHVWFNCFFEGNGPERMAASATQQEADAEDRERGVDTSAYATGATIHTKKPPPKSTGGPLSSNENPFHRPSFSQQIAMTESSIDAQTTVTAAGTATTTAAPKIKVPSTARNHDTEATAPEQSGVFNIAWDDMDGIKGSSRKGVPAFQRVALVWRVAHDTRPSVSPVPMTREEIHERMASNEPPPANTAEAFDHPHAAPAHISPEGENKRPAQRRRGRSAVSHISTHANSIVIAEPAVGDTIVGGKAANWRGAAADVHDEGSASSDEDNRMAKDLGPSGGASSKGSKQKGKGLIDRVVGRAPNKENDAPPTSSPDAAVSKPAASTASVSSDPNYSHLDDASASDTSPSTPHNIAAAMTNWDEDGNEGVRVGIVTPESARQSGIDGDAQPSKE